MSNINITDTNSFKIWLGTVPEADRLKAAQFVCGVWVAVTLPSIIREFEAQLSQDQAKISKTLQRLLVSSLYGMSVYNIQLDKNTNIKDNLSYIKDNPLASFNFAEPIVLKEIWFDGINLKAGNLTRCKDAVANYIYLINDAGGLDVVDAAATCVTACVSLYMKLANGNLPNPWGTISG